MNFIRDLANSELAKNNIIGFAYYAGQLAGLDNNYIQELDNYNRDRESKFYASSNPIKTYYGDSKGANLKLKNIENKDKFIGKQAVGYLLYLQFRNYFSRDISLDKFTYICFFKDIIFHLVMSKKAENLKLYQIVF